MKSFSSGSLQTDPSNRKLCSCSIFHAAAFLCMVFVVGTSFVAFDYKEKMSAEIPTDAVEITRGNLQTDLSKLQTPRANSWSHESTQSKSCESPCTSLRSEPLPKGIVMRKSDLEMVPLWGPPKAKESVSSQKSLLAIPVGIKQKEIVNKIVTKFASHDFTVMLFHYDGVVDEWKDLQWSEGALHISAINQTKWWFAKRFLHPDIVAPYRYIFLWDEDLEVQNFHPERTANNLNNGHPEGFLDCVLVIYLSIVEREGLEISQPALDPAKSQIHHQITARLRKGHVHRRMYKFNGGGKCSKKSSSPPCTGWVEMMAPVFSRAAWRCAWHMIQNDLIYAWGLDMNLGYCAQGDRTKKVGVVDSEYIVHKGLPTLGGSDEKMGSSDLHAANHRFAVRRRSYVELEIFRNRWQKAMAEDKCWTNSYPEH